MICGGITMEEMSIQSMCACAASVRETSTSETTPSSIKISTTPGSPFRSDRALSICGRVMSPPSSRTLSTYSSLCCTWEECWAPEFTVKPLNFQREKMVGTWRCDVRTPQRGVPTEVAIIQRSRFWRGSVVYRHRDRAQLQDDKREVEVGRRSESA